MNKPRIALLVDSDRWAFANIAKQLKKNLSKYYDITIIPSCYFDDVNKAFVLLKNYDLVHFFWRMIVYEIYSNGFKEYLKTLGDFDSEIFNRYINSLNISTCVYDHLFIDKDNFEMLKTNINLAKNYYVSSNKLKAIYNELDLGKKPIAVLPDGVDLEIFFPKDISRFEKRNNKQLVVGWAGNSKWHVGDLKGIHTIIKPAIQELQNEGYNIKLLMADRNESFLPQQQMFRYYSKLDVYVCASTCEGTPNPVLESMACGVPVISTDVGIVQEAFGEKQREFILPTRSVQALKEKLIRLYNKQSLLKELSNENINSIKNWDWKIMAMEFKQYFDKCL